MVKDLPKLASNSCGGLNLEEELKKYLLPSPPRTPPKTESRKRKIALSGPEAQKRLKEGMMVELNCDSRPYLDILLMVTLDMHVRVGT